MATTKRLDIDSILYSNLIKYYLDNDDVTSKFTTKGSYVLASINDLYIKHEKTTIIDQDILTKLSGFKNFGLLDGKNSSEVINNALKKYIEDNKDELQKKISEL